MPEGIPEAPPFTIFDWFYILGWTAFPLIFFAVLLTVWAARLFFRSPSVNQIAAFSITAVLPTMIGLIGFATQWRRFVEAMGLSGGWDPGKFLSASEEAVLNPVIGLIESILFLCLAVIIFLRYKSSSSQRVTDSLEQNRNDC